MENTTFRLHLEILSRVWPVMARAYLWEELYRIFFLIFYMPLTHSIEYKIMEV